jgi:hypothetical protein
MVNTIARFAVVLSASSIVACTKAAEARPFAALREFARANNNSLVVVANPINCSLTATWVSEMTRVQRAARLKGVLVTTGLRELEVARVAARDVGLDFVVRTVDRNTEDALLVAYGSPSLLIVVGGRVVLVANGSRFMDAERWIGRALLFEGDG